MFIFIAMYIGIKKILPYSSRTYTKKRLFSIPLLLIASVLWVYWASGYGFEGPARFFGDAWPLNKYFFTYIAFYFIVMYAFFWIGFLGVWLLTNAIKEYFFNYRSKD